MLRAIALYLQLPENYFDDKVKNGNSILRPIHYFPIDNPQAVPADAVRAEQVVGRSDHAIEPRFGEPEIGKERRNGYAWYGGWGACGC